MICPSCESENLKVHAQNPPRWICGDCSKTTRKPLDGYQFPVVTATSTRFVITWAQNATAPHKSTLRTLLQYCKHNKAQLLVIPSRYRNATSVWSKAQQDQDWWHKELTPYLLGHELELNPNLVVGGDVRLTPTAANPLQGMQTVSGHKSYILGHPQIAFETVATPQSKLAKIITSTGAITKSNYSDTTAGKKGAFHHELGATLVELDGSKFHIRQLIANGHGVICDLDKRYDGKTIKGKQRAECFVSGDFHGKYLDEKVKAAWWTGKNSLFSLIKPKVQVFHDVFDGYFGSHHHNHDPFLTLRKHFNGDNDGQNELIGTLQKLDDCMLADKNYIVKSNHDEHLDRWLKETDWRKDPANAEFYLQTALAIVQAIKSGNKFDALEYWAKQTGLAKGAIFLKRSQVMAIKDFLMSLHGDKGINGARGSVKSFNKIGSQSVTGHGHAPAKEKGAWRVGISCIHGLEYATGSPSSWMQTAHILYSNGKGSLISCIDGEYRK